MEVFTKPGKSFLRLGNERVVVGLARDVMGEVPEFRASAHVDSPSFLTVCTVVGIHNGN